MIFFLHAINIIDFWYRRLNFKIAFELSAVSENIVTLLSDYELISWIYAIFVLLVYRNLW